MIRKVLKSLGYGTMCTETWASGGVSDWNILLNRQCAGSLGNLALGNTSRLYRFMDLKISGVLLTNEVIAYFESTSLPSDI